MALQISREQLRQMLGQSEPLLLAALERLVREAHGAVVDDLPQPLVDAMLRKGLDTAQRYGLIDPVDVATFVLLMFEFGPDFHRHTAVLDRLTDRALPVRDRLAAVVSQTPEAVWQEIESTLPRQRWF